MSPLQRGSILIVDDSPGVLRIAETVLSAAGHQVRCVDNAADVLQVAAEFPPHLVVVDYGIGGAGGYTLCEQLGEEPTLEGVPIIVMNNRGDPVRERFIRELGIVDHITKPFAPEALVAVVEHTLARPNFRRQPFGPGIELLGRNSPRAASRLAEELADALCLADDQVVERIERLLESKGSGPLIRDLFFERHDRPGLTGDLAVVGVAEVLQVLSLQRQSGFLRVTHNDAAISLAIESGTVRLVTAENMGDEFLLGTILVREGLVPAAELDVLLNNRKGTRQRLGNQIVKLGYLSREQLHGALRVQSSELTYALLRWGTGRYAFTPAAELPAAVLEFEFGLTTDELLMEGFRRVDEWGLIEAAIPSLDTVLLRVPGGEAHAGPEGLTADENAALMLVDGRRTAREIIQEMARPTFDGARLLYRLVAAHVVTLPNQEPTPVRSPRRRRKKERRDD